MRNTDRSGFFRLALACAAALLVGSGDAVEAGKGFPVTKSDPDALVLAQDGRSEYRVVIAESAHPQIKAVAEDFVRIFREMTGAEIPLVTDAEPMGAREIIIGPSTHLDQLSMYIDWDALGEEGYVIRTRAPSPLLPSGPHLALFGGPVGGTRNAVYTFLDEHLGCRFYSPWLTVIPKRPDLRIGILHEERVPAFEARNVCAWVGVPLWASRVRLNYFRADIMHSDWLTAERIREIPTIASWVQGRSGHDYDWLRLFREKFTSDPLVAGSLFYAGKPNPAERHLAAATGLHTLGKDMLVPSSLFEEHPDYFALRSDKYEGKRYPGNGVCPSSPGALAVAVETAKDWLRQAPYARIISVSMADLYYACGCERCAEAGKKWTYTQAVTPDGKTTRPTNNRWLDFSVTSAGVLLDFVNRAADEIHKEFPDVLVHTFAYNWTTYPPDNWEPAPGLVIDFAPLQSCRYHPLGQCPHNEEAYGNLTKLRLWTKRCPHVWIWDYAYKNAHMPAPVLKYRGLSYRELATAGVNGAVIHMCGNIDQWLGELRIYLYSKLMWNPYYDVFGGIAEYCTHAYGAAAELMHRYILDTQDAAHYGYEPPKGYPVVPGLHSPGGIGWYVKDEALPRWDQMLTEAEAAVQDDPESLARVRLQHEIHRSFMEYCEKTKK